MFIPYLLKLRLERYKRDKQIAIEVEEDLLHFQNMSPIEQEIANEWIEQKLLKQIPSVARTTLTEAQRLRHNQIMKIYRKRKKEAQRIANSGILFSNYPARNPVPVRRIRIKGEDF
jgi:hypothetical protein